MHRNNENIDPSPYGLVGCTVTSISPR